MEKYLIINTKILPEVYSKVVETKELLKTGEAKDITEAVKSVGISRSSYYKYKDYVFTVSEGTYVHKATIAFSIYHKAGTLSKILDKMAKFNGNILTINQGIPINNAANLTITLDISNINTELDDLIREIGKINNVIKVNLIALG